ncbi:MAG: acyltransferase [Betaproteobacteria bacterium]|nr:acyltransferase [Betaproteobacteria bacterium]
MNAPHAPSSRHWAHIHEVTYVAGMRFLFWIFRIFGRWPFRLFLYPVLGWYLLTQPDARAASREYLTRVALTKKDVRTPGMRQVLIHFATFAESILDKLMLWNGQFDTSQVAVNVPLHLQESLAARQGVLFICSHFGNLELCKILSREKPGLSITMLVHTKHAPVFNQLLKQISPDSQLNLMQVTEISPATAILLSEKMQQGECVVIAGDRIPVSVTPRVATASFLGKRAAFPVGPYVLASLMRCPVFLMFTLHRNGMSEIHFEPFSDAIRLPRKDREIALDELAAQYARRLEYYCLQTPMQWFNFYDFWDSSKYKNE